MKRITFKWSNTITSGDIISQIVGGSLGLITKIKGDNGITYTLYGKCQIGNCGPFTVISID